MNEWALDDAIELLEKIIKEKEKEIKRGTYLEQIHAGKEIHTIYMILAQFKGKNKTKKSPTGIGDLE
jgi:hypothetical protein